MKCHASVPWNTGYVPLLYTTEDDSVSFVSLQPELEMEI
jgi:hypothetical protein